jgi:hypothetical protein
MMVMKDGVVYRHGHGKMFRRMPFGGYETIEGIWGGGHDVDYERYSNDFVSEATACRISNNGSETIEGIAMGGNWYKGNYIGGSCLSWRVNFGSSVVFNYTGALSGEYSKIQPIEGVVTFHKIEQSQGSEGSEGIINSQILESLLVRSFTVTVAVENEKQITKDFGIWVTFSVLFKVP